MFFCSDRREIPFIILSGFLLIILMSVTLARAEGSVIAGGLAVVKEHEEESHEDSDRGEEGDKESGDGGEILGQAAAWLFGLANLTVILSLIIRGLVRIFPLNSQIQKSLNKFNLLQKKYLKKTHYWVNPLAVGTAFIHFTLVSCPFSPLPELGLIIISLILILGVLLKIKGSPKVIKRVAYKVHTHPIISIIMVSIVLTGHLLID